MRSLNRSAVVQLSEVLVWLCSCLKCMVCVGGVCAGVSGEGSTGEGTSEQGRHRKSISGGPVFVIEDDDEEDMGEEGGPPRSPVNAQVRREVK
jgi:hypothetical protein